MLFSFGIVKCRTFAFNYVFLNWIVFFYIVLCSSVLDYDLLHCIMQNQIMFTVAITRFHSSVLYYGSRVVLCFSVLNYDKVIYAYVISYVALKFGRVGNGYSVSKWRNALFNILRQLESGNNSFYTLDHVQYRLDCLYEIILGCFDIGFIEESVVTVVREALDYFKLNDNDVMYKAEKVFIGSSGEQLEFLVQNIKC